MDKPVFNLKFWFNLALVIGATYIIIWYVLAPTNNLCQMTFMMEPPKFLPVPIELDHDDGELKFPDLNIKGSASRRNGHQINKYTLFLYSEFGYPQSANIERDLKDSMPVLFVPGNAGSYQQVRSLASTCIRRQLQSLDAFKFAFYTIDFKDQLSGISGQLIEDQTLFVSKALKQIQKMHPAETNGVILIGHSVGGFISKVLFTLPNFKSDSVPLLISLASPLNMPYLSFDDKIGELYRKTDQFWNDQRANNLKTIAISISGGRFDRLVPTHHSLDPQYDLSLTTSSIKNVWLPTDHVCITWCRELMQKLSHLLSALMDKRNTHLIKDRSKAMKIITDELLSDDKSLSKMEPRVIYKDWKSMRPHTLIDLEEHYSATRAELYNEIIILNMTNIEEEVIFIHANYIESSKRNGIFACEDLTISGQQIHCNEKIDLSYMAVTIPTRKYDPKKINIKLESQIRRQYKYLLIDYNGHSSSRSENFLPELVTIQTINPQSIKQILYIPSLFEAIAKKILLIHPSKYIIKREAEKPIVYKKFKLDNLKYESQVFSVKYEANNCKFHDGQSRGATILLSKSGYLSESFHLMTNDKNMSIVVNLSSQKTIMFGGNSKTKSDHEDQDSYLEFFIDGGCDHSLIVDLDLFNLVIETIQKNLSLILTCSTYLSCIYINQSATSLMDKQQITFNSYLMQFIGFIIVYLSPTYSATTNTIALQQAVQNHSSDKIVSFLIIYGLSNALIAFIDYFNKRLIDLATIINNLQLILRKRLNQNVESINVETNGKNHSTSIKKTTSSSMSRDFDWLLMGLAIGGSVMFSNAIISLFTIFIIMKIEINVQRLLKKGTSDGSNCCPEQHEIDKHEKGMIETSSNVHNMLTTIMTLCSMAMISNIPSALLKINNNFVIQGSFIDSTFLAGAVSLIWVKMFCEKIYPNNLQIIDKQNSGQSNSMIKKIAIKFIHFGTLLEIFSIIRNICHINSVLFLTLTYLNVYLSMKFNQIKS